MPRVRHRPWAAATTGFVHSPSRRHGSRPPSGMGRSPLATYGATSTRSRPAVKCSPWANSTPTRRSSSDSEESVGERRGR